jgi:hypothetical protein
MESPYIIGMMLAVVLVICSYALYFLVIKDGSLLKSTMATYALGYPIGVVCTKDTIEIGIYSLFFIFAYGIVGFIVWGAAYYQEAPTKRLNILNVREKLNGIITDWLYIGIGVGAPKLTWFIMHFKGV